LNECRGKSKDKETPLAGQLIQE